jgi:transcription elongation factor GreA
MASLQPRFTREAYNRLSQELEALKLQRGGVIQDIKEAREQGDLRENFAYHDAKRAQGLLEARIGNLETRLADAIVVEDGATFDEVILGVPVRVRMNGGGVDEVRTYTIVSAEELDQVDNGASEDSPVGSALLGKKVGDVAEVQGPRGTVSLEIIAIGG